MSGEGYFEKWKCTECQKKVCEVKVTAFMPPQLPLVCLYKEFVNDLTVIPKWTPIESPKVESTDVSAYCSICNKDDGKETHVNKMVIVNGSVILKLSCGHEIYEKFSN